MSFRSEFHRVFCKGDVTGTPCKGGQPIELTEEEYQRQLFRPNDDWKCPRCRGSATWDDVAHERMYQQKEELTEELRQLRRHDMQITTKYSIGDTVFMIYENKIKETEIAAITIDVENNGSGTTQIKIQYVVTYFLLIKSDEQLFSSRKELAEKA